jgi:hypothetical protein
MEITTTAKDPISGPDAPFRKSLKAGGSDCRIAELAYTVKFSKVNTNIEITRYRATFSHRPVRSLLSIDSSLSSMDM